MKLIRNGIVVLNVKNDYVVIMQKSEAPSVWDPADIYWGLAQGFKVVTDISSKTFVLVPIGEPSRVKKEDFKAGELDDSSQS